MICLPQAFRLYKKENGKYKIHKQNLNELK